MKINLLLSFLLLFMQATTSIASDAKNALMLHRSNGQSVTIMFDELPVVTFSNNDLVVTTHMNTVCFPASDVARFTYLTVEPDGISNPSAYGILFTFGENTLNVSNVAPSSPLQVYAVDGVLLYSTVSDSRGNVNVPLQGASGTVYLVKTSSVTFKVRKP